MKKLTKKQIPYIMFLSELYVNLQDYYHSEKKKFPVFSINVDELDNIKSCIENSCKNKIKFENFNERISDCYDGLFLDKDSLILTRKPLPDNLYLDINPVWKNYVKDGFLDYMYNNSRRFNPAYMNKLDRKDYEYYLKKCV